MLGNLFSSNSAIKHLYLDDTSITHVGLADLIHSTVENLKLLSLSIKNSNIKISDPDQEEARIIIASMKQNCSLTKIDMEHNIRIDEDFQVLLDKELHRNEQIVEIIMPKIMAQEERAYAAKKKREEKPKNNERRRTTLMRKKTNRRNESLRKSAQTGLELPKGDKFTSIQSGGGGTPRNKLKK